jgi:protein-disulfide isomerase
MRHGGTRYVRPWPRVVRAAHPRSDALAKKKNNSGGAKAEAKVEDKPVGPSSNVLAALVALGALSAVWATFLWGQLLISRAGGKPFCGFSDSATCGALWDGGFASAVHSATGVPVAGWGLIWGVVAALAPLLALVRRDGGGAAVAEQTAIRLAAIAGVVTVLGLLMVSFSAGGLCTLCVGTYLLVGGYAALALVKLKGPFEELPRALTVAVGAVVATFVVLLYPGVSTPKSTAAATTEAIRGATDPGHQHAHTDPAPPADPHKPTEKLPFATGTGTGDPTRDGEIERFVSSLPPQLRSNLSSTLLQFFESPPITGAPAARSRWGDPSAQVQIVEWTDALCGHCAQMHATLDEISKVGTGSSFAVEPRHFPLDASCNPNVQRKNPAGPISCVAAGAQICLEGSNRAAELTKKIFENQRTLDSVDAVYALAEPFMPRDKLQACVESEDTKKKLQEDLAYALRTNPEGTPIVLVNGKKANGFGPLLYALILTNGTGVHPAFASLPPPDRHAHVH